MINGSRPEALPVCGQRERWSDFNDIKAPFFFYHCPPVTSPSGWALPDLDINVDFGPLVIGLSGMFQLSARTQLPLVIGLSDDLGDDLNYTVAVTIIPGINMAAAYTVDARQVYSNRALAAFGIFEVSL